MSRCKDCRHWAWHPWWSACFKMPPDDCRPCELTQKGNIPQPGAAVAINDDGGPVNTLLTHTDFGCVRFEQR